MAEEEINKEETNEETEVKQKKPVEKIDKIQVEKIRGRIIILNPEESEFSKKLGLPKKGDYFKKKA